MKAKVDVNAAIVAARLDESRRRRREERAWAVSEAEGRIPPPILVMGGFLGMQVKKFLCPVCKSELTKYEYPVANGGPLEYFVCNKNCGYEYAIYHKGSI
jgi:hypothetical protein